MGSKISNTEWWLVIGALATIDFVQFLLDFLLIGLVVNVYIDLAVGMSFPFYMLARGVKIDSKKVGGLVGAFLLEMIPGVDSLPLWCLDGIYNMLLDRADKKLQNTASSPDVENKSGV